MGENSFIGAFGIVVRPFFEELEGNWRIVKAICMGSLVVTISFWVFSWIASSPNNAKAIFILNTAGWFTCVIFVFTYGMLYWEMLLSDKDRQTAKHRKISGFTDVEKR